MQVLPGAVLLATRHAAAMLLDGLSCSCMLCKAPSCAKLAWMIDAGLEAIDHVSGSHQIGRFLHEDLIFSILGQRLLETSAVCCESAASVESYVLSL